MDEFINCICKKIEAHASMKSINASFLSKLPKDIKIIIIERNFEQSNLLVYNPLYKTLTIEKGNGINPDLYKDPRVEYIASYSLDCIEFNSAVKKLEVYGELNITSILQAMDKLPNAIVTVYLQHKKYMLTVQELVILAPRELEIKHYNEKMIEPYFTRAQLAQFAVVFFHLQSYPDIAKKIVHLLTKNG